LNTHRKPTTTERSKPLPRAEATEALERCLGPFALALLDRTAQPFLVVDCEGRVLRANAAFRDVLGYSAEEVEGLSILEITPERWRETTVQGIDRILAEGRPRRYEKEYRAKNGGLVPVELVADVLLDETGRLIGLYAFFTDLTERKRAERAMMASESRFRRLFDEAPFGYHEIDRDGRITAVNQAECELLGYNREELLGRPVHELVEESEREEARRAIELKLAGRVPLRPFERTYLRRDGRRLTVWIRERLRVDDEGRIHGLRTTLQDITEQKQMEAELIASQRRAQALFDGIEDAIFVHDLEGRLLEANPAATRLLGYSRDELLRKTTADIDADDFAEGFCERLEEQLRSGHLRCEGRHRTKDGRIIPVEINTSTIQLGDETAVMAVIRDVSERHALEETRRQFAEAQARNAEILARKNKELLDSEARYRQLTEASLDALVVADEQGRITLFNPAAERAFGYRAEEVLGQPLTLLMPEELAFQHDAGFRRYLETRQPRIVGRTIELRGRRASGEEFPLELSLNAVEFKGELQFIGSIRDLTERQRMRDMLIQSEKLASIGLLSAGVAHEINNPLAYVANNLAVLERDIGGILDLFQRYAEAEPAIAQVDPEGLERIRAVQEELDWEYVRGNLRRLLSKTREGVQRVASIVRNLRGMARTSPPHKEEVTLAELIASAVEMAQGQIRKANIQVEIDAPRELPPLPCVGSQIAQVILNLVINAVQAIQKADRPEGGRIAISVTETDGSQILEVADDGCGIEPADLPKLYDPFFTTKPIGEGTGLGLAISHSIVSGHGGTISVESQPGRGTRFRIELPKETMGERDAGAVKGAPD